MKQNCSGKQGARCSRGIPARHPPVHPTHMRVYTYPTILHSTPHTCPPILQLLMEYCAGRDLHSALLLTAANSPGDRLFGW